MLDRFTADMFATDLPVLNAVSRKSQFGQFMTPPTIAQFMARLFSAPFPGQVRLLDAGAGRGSLTQAFVKHWGERAGNGRLTTHAYEYDENLIDELNATLMDSARYVSF